MNEIGKTNIMQLTFFLSTFINNATKAWNLTPEIIKQCETLLDLDFNDLLLQS